MYCCYNSEDNLAPQRCTSEVNDRASIKEGNENNALDNGLGVVVVVVVVVAVKLLHDNLYVSNVECASKKLDGNDTFEHCVERCIWVITLSIHSVLTQGIVEIAKQPTREKVCVT